MVLTATGVTAYAASQWWGSNRLQAASLRASSGVGVAATTASAISEQPSAEPEAETLVLETVSHC